MITVHGGWVPMMCCTRNLRFFVEIILLLKIKDIIIFRHSIKSGMFFFWLGNIMSQSAFQEIK